MFERTAKKARRYISIGLLATMVPLAAGCYGNFSMTKAIYQMNRRAASGMGEDRTQNKLVQSVVMWILLIVPVYEVGMLADALVLNLIEFWTGDTIQVASVVAKDGTEMALAPSQDGKEAVLTISRDGETLLEQRVIKVDATRLDMRDGSGALSGMILKTPTGAIQLADAQGNVVETLSKAELARLGSH